MGRSTTAIGCGAGAVLVVVAGCSSTSSGVAEVPDARSDAASGPARVMGGAAVTGPAECAAAGGQCEVGAVCGLEQSLGSGSCGPVGAVCCLQVLCAADATVQLIQASDYDQSCAVDSDCVEVYVGNACTCDLSCQSKQAAINKAALSQYTADVAKAPRVACGCLRPPIPTGGVSLPCCVGGSCQFTNQCSNPVPVVDAAAETGTDAATDAAADAGAE